MPASARRPVAPSPNALHLLHLLAFGVRDGGTRCRSGCCWLRFQHTASRTKVESRVDYHTIPGFAAPTRRVINRTTDQYAPAAGKLETSLSSAANRGVQITTESKSNRIQDGRGGLEFATSDSLDLASLATKMFQSNVLEKEPSKFRLVDDLHNVQNYKLWKELMSFRERIQGWRGARMVFRGMRMRNVDLPVDDVLGKPLWKPLLWHTELHGEAVDYIIDLHDRRGVVYKPFYGRLISRSIFEKGKEAMYIHERLKAEHLVPSGWLWYLARTISLDQESLVIFRQLYLSAEEREQQVYDALINRLWRRGKIDDAIVWHKFFADHGDLPSDKMSDHPFPLGITSQLLKYPQTEGSQHSRTDLPSSNLERRHNDSITTVIPTSARSHLTREMMSRILGDVHGITPVDINDHICARFFATTAFPVDFIITGLSAFGVEQIGPHALRQLGQRVNSASQLHEKIQKLRQSAISIRQCTFTAAVIRLAREERDGLLKSILSSDQHPDVLDDKTMQIQLLKEFIDKKDWDNAYWTLYVLLHFHAESQYSAWNRLLQHHAKKSSWKKFSGVVNDVFSNKIPLAFSTVKRVMKHRLRPRRPGHEPIHTDEKPDDLLYLTNFLRACLDSGKVLDPQSWKEVTRRYGMTGRWTELSHLLLWLAQRYSTFTKIATPASREVIHTDLIWRTGRSERFVRAMHRTLGPGDPRHPLQQLFPPSRQQAIVSWGFKSGYEDLERNMQQDIKIKARISGPEHYPLRGLALLNQLQDFGVQIDIRAVLHTVTSRLWLLYGPGDISNVKQNRRARQINLWTLEEMLEGIQRITTEGSLKTPSESSSGDLSTSIQEPVNTENSHVESFKDVSTLSSVSRGAGQRNAQSTLDELLPSRVSATLQELARAAGNQPGSGQPSFVGEYTDRALVLSERARLKQRVRLAISLFRVGRYVYGPPRRNSPRRDRMTVARYVELVQRWAHKRQKRKLGMSGVLVRSRKNSFFFGGRAKRSALRRGLEVSSSPQPHLPDAPDR